MYIYIYIYTYISLYLFNIMMMIAFITFKSSLVPLFEGLWSSNSWEFELSGFRRNRTDDLGIDSPSLWPTEPRLQVRSVDREFLQDLVLHICMCTCVLWCVCVRSCVCVTLFCWIDTRESVRSQGFLTMCDIRVMLHMFTARNFLSEAKKQRKQKEREKQEGKKTEERKKK